MNARQRISELLDSESLAVVATSDAGAPYAGDRWYSVLARRSPALVFEFRLATAPSDTIGWS